MKNVLKLSKVDFTISSDSSIVVDAYDHAFVLSRDDIEMMAEGVDDIVSKFKQTIYREFIDTDNMKHTMLYDGSKFWFDDKVLSEQEFKSFHKFLDNYFTYFIYRR